MNDISQNCMFSGQEAKPLNMDTLLEAIDKLPKVQEPRVDRISHNCKQDDFLKLFDIEKRVKQKEYINFLGIPVYVKKWIPRGEIWLQDKDGKVVQKFSLPEGSTKRL